MAVTPAKLAGPQPTEDSPRFAPLGAYLGSLDDSDYVEEEWLASGEADGHPYATALLVRRPRQAERFSGVVVVEPLHVMGATPVWDYISAYMLRSGHGWVTAYSQKVALDTHVKPSNPARYESLDIWADAPAEGPLDVSELTVDDPARVQDFFDELDRLNAASNTILAQIGIALPDGPFAGLAVNKLLLAGHSQTGMAVTSYIRNAHDRERRADGTSVYDGYFPSGASGSDPFGPRDVPLVQVISDGDIATPDRFGQPSRSYRRDDSDADGDRYRLYELAGISHMGTRHAPYNDASFWLGDAGILAGTIPDGARMNSLPHGELFSMGIDHLVQWVANDVTPPRAERIEVDSSGLLAADEHGNTRGGVRSAQLDVPRARYYSTPGVEADGTPAFGVVGIEVSLSDEQLGALYRDDADYAKRFNRRVDELVDEGWLLADDADEVRHDAEKAPTA